VRVPRLYLPVSLVPGQELALDERCHRHAVQVLRLKPGAPLVLFNGDGNDYPAELLEAERRASTVRVLERRKNASESPLAITLVQGVAKGDHMDYSLQKAVELGVDSIVPVLCERSVARLDDRRLEKKHEHWMGIVLAACEQSGRSRIPGIGAIQPLDAWLESFSGAGLVLDPRARLSLGSIPAPADRCCVLVGPEGGLSETELDKARAAGLNAIRFGPRILRTETAASAVLTALQLRWGDLDATPADQEAGCLAPGQTHTGS